MPRPIVWLRNTVRNRVRTSMLGRLLMGEARLKRLVLVTCSRKSDKAFWTESALGQSLRTWKNDPRLSLHIEFENRRGLPAVYNPHLSNAGPEDAVLFVHDDIWLDDPQWIDKVFVALKQFDAVGAAGNTRRRPGQTTWLFREFQGEQGWMDVGFLSGTVSHGMGPRGEPTVFGPAPASCELIDGLFIAVRARVFQRARVGFDTLFDFHFYDLDFCRSARAAGLSIGTWPIEMTHQSSGAFTSPGWREGLARYRSKWRT